MNRKLIHLAFVILVGVFLISACKKKVKTEVIEVPSVAGRPSVTTLAIDSLSSSSVILLGQITREGNGDVATAGFCWSDEKQPIVDETPTNYQFPDNRFKYRLTGLKPGTTYNFRAFATNEKGTAYGEMISFKTLEGWKKVEQGPNAQIRQFTSIISTGTKLVGISAGAIFTSADNGLTWSSSSNGVMSSVNCLANRGETLFAGTSNGVYVSNNGGGIWIPATNGLNNSAAINRLHVQDNYVFAVTNYSLFRSANNGQAWTAATFSNVSSYFSGLTSQGTSLVLMMGYLAYLSDDNGANWTEVPSNQNIYANDIEGTTDALVAITSQKLYRSFDKAKTWAEVVLPGYVNQLTASGNNIIAYGNGGSSIYISSDGGKSWTRNDGGLQGMGIGTCVFHKNYILASTYNGLYKLMLN